MTSGHPGKGLEYLRVPLMLAPVACCCGELQKQPKRELKALLGLPHPSDLLLSLEPRPFCRMASEKFCSTQRGATFSGSCASLFLLSGLHLAITHKVHRCFSGGSGPPAS